YRGWENWGHVHVFPDGEIRMLVPGSGGYALAETDDDGLTWSRPEAIEVKPAPEEVERLHLGPQALVNLSDGSMVMFGYGRYDFSREEMSIFTWGSHHCQAYSCRSADGGRSWSNWVNVDGAMDSQGQPVAGSLDLTEVCGVQTGDGSILAMIRPIYSPWMWETWSHDGGISWTPCVRGPFPGYATPNMLRTCSGRILVAHRLPGCTINSSMDDGVTWDQGTMIDSAIWVMGSMLEVDEDLVLYVYYDSFESMMRAQFIRLTDEGIFPAGF
ncbi:MAG: exo-alpha-sialidase, partial [Theionarchaea archaeon]|nr:exo-alpha-sialidase [Theionarchaea archaeon]